MSAPELGRSPGGLAEMSENPSDDRGIFNGSDDLHGTTTVVTALDVDIEYPFTKTVPGFRPSGRRSPEESEVFEGLLRMVLASGRFKAQTEIDPVVDSPTAAVVAAPRGRAVVGARHEGAPILLDDSDPHDESSVPTVNLPGLVGSQTNSVTGFYVSPAKQSRRIRFFLL